MLLQKKKASIIVKVVALVVAVAFVLTLVVVWTAPTYKETGSKLDPEREAYYEENTTRVQQALQQNPDDLQTTIEAGNLYFDWGEELLKLNDDKNAAPKFSQAIVYYQKALDVDPQNSNVRTDMGHAFFHLNQVDRALTEFQTSIQHHPDHAMSYYWLGRAYQAQNKKNETIQAWEKYLELDPQGDLVKTVKAELSRLKGQ